MKRYFAYPVIFLSIILGYIFPEGKVLKWSIPYLLAILLFLAFIKIDFRFSDLRRRELLLYAILSILIMPALTFFIFKNLFPFEFRIGLFLLSCIPIALAMSGIIDLLPQGDQRLVLSITIVFTLSSAFYIPVLIFIYFSTYISINITGLFFNLIIIIFLPWATAEIFKRYIKKVFISYISRYSFIINFIVLFIIIYVSVSGARDKISLNLSMFYLFLAVLAISIVHGTIAYIFARIFDAKHEPSFTLISASKNTQLGLLIALMNFGEKAAIPTVLGIIANHLTYSILLIIFHLTRKPELLKDEIE